MIKYVIQAKKNPLKKNEVKYYPQMAPTTPMTLAQIVKRVEKTFHGFECRRESCLGCAAIRGHRGFGSRQHRAARRLGLVSLDHKG